MPPASGADRVAGERKAGETRMIQTRMIQTRDGRLIPPACQTCHVNSAANGGPCRVCQERLDRTGKERCGEDYGGSHDNQAIDRAKVKARQFYGGREGIKLPKELQ